ncbi:MAG: patatin family protein [Oscillospiraceae bacterium]|nr:patatin family protein [Oscillospiraceae bacterium]
MGKSALVLEGGGMRGAYTAGILDYFMEKGLNFDTVYGVSAGALNGANYKAHQIGRGLRTFASYLHDERYAGLQHLMKTGDWFNIDFSYNIIPNQLDPADYDAFAASDVVFYAVVANVETGRAEYLKITDLRQQMDQLRASATLPLLSNIVETDGKKYLDGGICDSIPLKKAVTDGHDKNVVILTQHRGFRKKPSANRYPSRVMYNKYPKFVKAMNNRHFMYNRQLRYTYEMEKRGKAFVIQPAKPVEIARLEKNPAKLVELYHQGKLDAEKNYAALIEYMKK